MASPGHNAFTTELRLVCRAPIVQVWRQDVNVPWAGKHSRFTLMFEAFAIEVLQACSNVNEQPRCCDSTGIRSRRLWKDRLNAGWNVAALSGQRCGMDEKAFKSHSS